ncbi:MAG: LysE family transporter, partial [Cucumibacter sp.]
TWLESQLPADDPDLDLPLLVFFRRGLVTNLLNPKAAIFYVTVMPNFTQAGTPLWPQMAILTLVYVSAATLVHSGIVVVAASLTAAFARDHWRRTLGIVFALLLVAVAGWLAVNTAR